MEFVCRLAHMAQALSVFCPIVIFPMVILSGVVYVAVHAGTKCAVCAKLEAGRCHI